MDHPGGTPVWKPPPQRPYELAFRFAFEALRREEPSDDKLRALGAARNAGMIRIPALHECLLVDMNRQEVFVAGEADGESRKGARHAWALLSLHYLCAADLSVDAREVSFGYFTDSRGYESVFAKRVVGRFLAMTGKTRRQFEEASQQIRGRRLSGPGVGYEFCVLPRVPIVIVWHPGDQELGPAANVIYHADAAHLLPAEDRIVAAELLVDMLSGKPLTENGGSHAKRH